VREAVELTRRRLVEHYVASSRAPRCNDRLPALDGLLDLADIVAHTVGPGTRGERLVPPLDPAAWNLLEVPVSALASIVEQTRRQLDGACALVRGAAA
jgi:hypothetical protein